MEINRLLRGCCIVLAVIQVIWFCLPYIDIRWMTAEELTILSYGGYGAFFDFSDTTFWLYNGLFLSAVTAVYIAGGRALHFLGLVVSLGLIVLVVMGGMVIEVGYSTALRDLANIVLGCVIALAILDRKIARAE